jgi:hypothetical protein
MIMLSNCCLTPSFIHVQCRVPIKCESNRNETKSTKMKRNQWNENGIKRNQRKQNEIDWYEENGRKKIKDKTK